MLELGMATCHVDTAPSDSSPDSLSPEARGPQSSHWPVCLASEYLTHLLRIGDATARLTLLGLFYDILAGRVEEYDEGLNGLWGWLIEPIRETVGNLALV